jgi:diguanylate cyclase
VTNHGTEHPPSSPDNRRHRLRFHSGNRRSLLWWPLAALALAALGWTGFLVDQAAHKRSREAAAEKEVSALAREYAVHVAHNLRAADQVALYIKHGWESSAGNLQLDRLHASGVLPPSAFFVAIIDRNGDLVSSSMPALQMPNGSTEPFFLAQLNSVGTRLHIGTARHGIYTNRTVIQNSHKLLDAGGDFDGVVLVSILAEDLVSHYDQAAVGSNGLLAVLGSDGGVRVARFGDTLSAGGPSNLASVPRTGTTSGTLFLSGPQWFPDQRSRYVGWQAIGDYSMIVLTGLDQEEVFAPYWAERRSAITVGLWATATLAVFTLIGMSLSMRLQSKQVQLDDLRTTYRMATEGGSEGFYISRPVLDLSGRTVDYTILDCNQRGAEFFNLRREDLIGKGLSRVHGDFLRQRLSSCLSSACETGVCEGELQLDAEHPLKLRWLHLRAVRSDGDLALTLRDISDSKAHVMELEKKGNEDALTALPNRRWLKEYLPKAVRLASERNSMLAVLFIDLDGFKAANDALGHEAGDELLRNAGRRIKVAVRPNDHVARIGGDEFVVVVEGIADKESAAHVAERIQAAFRETFRLSQGTHSVGTSIGISIYPDDATEADTLLNHADVAMYSVKSHGKRNFRFFDQGFYEATRRRQTKESELLHAIGQEQFVIHYQPRVDLWTGAVLSMEALVRWAHPTKGLILPNDFITLAEETGLVIRLGEQVIEMVCAQLAQWSQHQEHVVPVSINVSPRHFRDADIAHLLAKSLTHHKVDPRLIEIELTESSMMGNSEEVRRTLAAIQRMGIKLLVDDFGTGYSSLSQLQELDFDMLKVDRSFTAKLCLSPEGQAFYTAIITLAHALGMRVVAEGVENVAQMEALKRLHCDEVQGYYISRPLPPAPTQTVLTHWSGAMSTRAG